MTRFALVFLALGLAARASDFIAPPKQGVSATVAQPHVTAQLISETTHVKAGKPFLVALHLHMDKGWHTYWVNPGDAGLATTITWTLPPGFTAGPIQWPTPELHMMGPLTTYGYAGDAYLLTTITPTQAWAELEGKPEIKAHADWLVCQEECIPGKADLALETDTVFGFKKVETADEEKFFGAAQARLPVPNTRWDIKASYGERADTNVQPAPQALNLVLSEQTGQAGSSLENVRFFPEQANVLGNDTGSQGRVLNAQSTLSFSVALQQNGEKPDHLSGVLTSDQPLQGDGAKAVYISSFPVTSESAPVAASANAAPAASSSAPPTQTDPSTSLGMTNSSLGMTATEAQPWLIAVLGAAFLGGLILNLMPCVLPVLSLKVFSLVRHAGDKPGTAWRQGAAFTAGVVISFWILAGLLIALRAAGNHLGWGFQMQSPGFVLALIFLFFLIGLNLFGVFELGTSLVGLDAKTTGRIGHGLTSSFLNGALATLAATPCTAPFMGSSVGFAAEQPPSVALLIFTVLALGMASPYLLLTIFPGALRFVPKPGPWMEAFKQFMGFLLLATVIFLIYVFGALVGLDQIPALLAALLVAGVGAWIYGRWGGPDRVAVTRTIAGILTLLCLVYAITWGADLARATPPKTSAQAQADGWQPWSTGAVDLELARQRPVFVDFTAAWCLSCKVNERVALDTGEVKQAFSQKNVALFRADWTHSDPAISAVLAKFHRDGVPLYLLYSPKAKTTPQVLPEVLTPGIVLEALKGT